MSSAKLELTYEELMAINDTLRMSLLIHSDQWGYVPNFRQQIQKKVYALLVSPKVKIKLTQGKANED